MFSGFSQIFALVQFNLRTMWQRKGSSAAALFGIAGVVAVLVGVLSIAQGFRGVMDAGGKLNLSRKDAYNAEGAS